MKTKSFFAPPQPPSRLRIVRGLGKTFAVVSKKRLLVPRSPARKGSMAKDAVGDRRRSGALDFVTEAYLPDARARAILKGVVIAHEVLKDAGGAFELEQVRALLGGVSRQAVSKRVADGSLLAVPGPNGRRVYPTLQFNPGGTIVEGLKAVQDALPTRNAWSVLSFLAEPEGRLGGRTPIEWLRAGNVDMVVEAARRYGEQGA